MQSQAAAFGPATAGTAARRSMSTLIRSRPATAAPASPQRTPSTTRDSGNSFCRTTPCMGQATPTSSCWDFCRRPTQRRRSWRTGIARRWSAKAPRTIKRDAAKSRASAKRAAARNWLSCPLPGEPQYAVHEFEWLGGFVPRRPLACFARSRISASRGARRRPPAIQSFFIAGMRVGEGSGLDTMTKKRGWKAYVAVFVAIAFASSVATSLMMMMFQNFNCRTPHDPDDFLAYCRSLGFVDYEHGALYYGLEPKVRDSIRTAQVLFLGSSRVQAAFAANALRKYFKARGIRYFVMGFGYGEASAFGQPVMERSHASPKVIVINADPFFVVPEMVSEPAKDAIKGGAGYLWRLMSKMAFQRIHRIICHAVPVCPESEPSIFRSAGDGQWNWVGPYMEERDVPISQEFKERLPENQIEQAKILGETFLNRIGLDRRCIVLTGTPNTGLNSTEIAQVLATALHTRFVAPRIEGLSTLDGG